jgi:hypothetical protein
LALVGILQLVEWDGNQALFVLLHLGEFVLHQEVAVLNLHSITNLFDLFKIWFKAPLSFN